MEYGVYRNWSSVENDDAHLGQEKVVVFCRVFERGFEMDVRSKAFGSNGLSMAFDSGSSQEACLLVSDLWYG